MMTYYYGVCIHTCVCYEVELTHQPCKVDYKWIQKWTLVLVETTFLT